MSNISCPTQTCNTDARFFIDCLNKLKTRQNSQQGAMRVEATLPGTSAACSCFINA